MSSPTGDERLERIVRDVAARAVRAVDPRRIWLFGSSARGTHTRASDVDLAFELSEAGRADWTAFVLEAQDEVPALVDLDLVDLAECAPSMVEEIIRTGRLVYERAP